MKTYLKFLSRNKGYTAINLIGFAVALAFVVLLGLYVREENSADRFHEKGGRIYRMTHDGGSSNFAFPLAGDLQARYPEIEATVRIAESWPSVRLTAGGEKFDTHAMIADSTFFSVFSFPLKEGDPARQIQTSGDVTISEEYALRLFGSENPMGKPLIINDVTHTVTGIMSKFPKSHLRTPDILLRLDNTHLHASYFNSGYDNNSWPLYLMAREGADLPAKADDITAWFKTFYWLYKNNIKGKVVLEPIADSYFNKDATERDMNSSNNRGFLALLEAAGLAILLFALINYVNLSVAVGGFRAREAAMRRLLGGSRARLLRGYLGESVAFCFAAFVLAVGLAFLIEPQFNGVMDSEVSVVDALRHPLVLVGAVLVLGIVSGLAPAFVITRPKPINVVRGDFTRRTRMVWSRLFIGLQFALTMVLIGCAIVIGRQTHYMRTTDLGFDRSNLIDVHTSIAPDRQGALRSLLMAVPGVEQVSFTAGSPRNGGNNNTNNYPDGRSISFQTFVGDSLLLDILDIEIVRRTGVTDPDAVWLNERAVQVLGLASDSLSFEFNRQTHPIAGVVRDFHFRDMNNYIGPLVIEQRAAPWPWEILVRVAPGNPAEVLEKVTQVVHDFLDGEPTTADFFDDAINEWYTAQRRTGRLIAGFSLLAVVISVMGLVAMTTYFMRQRQRDIAVRKVFGATSSQVMGRLVGSFMMLVLCAFVAAVPLIWFLMNRWLSTFAYHIKLGWVTFLLAGLIVAIVALLAVWSQSLAAARRNPVSSLRSE